MLTEAHWQDEWELDKIKFVLTNNTIFRNWLPTVLVFIPFKLVVHTQKNYTINILIAHASLGAFGLEA